VCRRSNDNILSRFHRIPERDGRIDGQTELLYQYRASMLSLTPETSLRDSCLKTCSLYKLISNLFSTYSTYSTLLGFNGGSGVFILGATGMATLSSGGGGHTTNTFVLNYRVCNRLYQIINT